MRRARFLRPKPPAPHSRRACPKSNRESNLPPLLDARQQEVPLPPTVVFREGFRAHPDGRRNLQLARMVFSCLRDADFVDTDNFYRGIEGRPGREDEIGPAPGLPKLRERLDAQLAGFPQEGSINPLRRRILRHVRGWAMEASVRHAERWSGLGTRLR